MDPSLEQEPEFVDRELIDALLEKLDKVSLAWGRTFCAFPAVDAKGYRNLAGLIKRYGAERVVEVLTFCVERDIAPHGDNAIPLVVALAKANLAKRGAQS